MLRFAVLATTLAIAAPIVGLSSASASAGQSGWGAIGPFRIGASQSTIYRKYGFGTSHAAFPFTRFKFEGGLVLVYFGGGSRKTRHQVTGVTCSVRDAALQGGGCPRGFALPDGVRLGFPIPPGATWRGYRMPIKGDRETWRKTVRSGNRSIIVTLSALVDGQITLISEMTS